MGTHAKERPAEHPASQAGGAVHSTAVSGRATFQYSSSRIAAPTVNVIVGSRFCTKNANVPTRSAAVQQTSLPVRRSVHVEGVTTVNTRVVAIAALVLIVIVLIVLFTR